MNKHIVQVLYYTTSWVCLTQLHTKILITKLIFSRNLVLSQKIASESWSQQSTPTLPEISMETSDIRFLLSPQLAGICWLLSAVGCSLLWRNSCNFYSPFLLFSTVLLLYTLYVTGRGGCMQGFAFFYPTILIFSGENKNI